MINIPIETLLARMDSKYALAVAAAKRARQIMNGAPAMVESHSTQPVTLALEEIAAGKLEVTRPDSGVK
ncbi:MAG: DNA-directed RNA polymerase subunit omega [Firmicutes bacterium]|nr:DNA-directed RNA polymerase subunit omega [Bacillota bacterium]